MVEFRRKNGRNIPIHGARGSAQICNSQRGIRATCFLTPCPRQCGRHVFFIRHNGGSIWINPPLGYPWIKHECMYQEDVRAGRSLALLPTAPNETSPRRPRLLLAIVTKANYDGKRLTTLQLDAGKTDRWSAIVKHDRQFLLDELVIVDRSARTMARFDSPFKDRLLSLKRLT